MSTSEPLTKKWDSVNGGGDGDRDGGVLMGWLFLGMGLFSCTETLCCGPTNNVAHYKYLSVTFTIQ